MKRTPWIAVAAGLLIFAGQAVACDRAEMREQIEADRTAAFEAADEDGNGTLSRAEFDTFREEMQDRRAEAQFSHVDADGDDAISQDELVSALGRRRHPRHGQPPL